MDKRGALGATLAQAGPGSIVALGGSGLDRKPLALVRTLLKRGATQVHALAVVGGPEIDLLIAAGTLRELTYAYVGLELAGLAPHFRRAREAGALRFHEWSEQTLLLGLEAAVRRLPFLPTRAALGSGLPAINEQFQLFAAPFTGETLLAVPALRPDLALIHVTEADPAGNARIAGDRHADVLLSRAACATVVSAERVVERLAGPADLLACDVAAVVEAPGGAEFTGCYPLYPPDLAAVLAYQRAAADPAAWPGWWERWLAADRLEAEADVG